MTIKPRKNQILLKYIEREEITKGGIALPDSAERENVMGLVDRGQIVTMGPDVDIKEFKIGDLVTFKKAEPLHITLSGSDTEDGREENYLMISSEHITCKIV